MNDKIERSFGETLAAFIGVALVFLVSVTIDTWLIGAIEDSFSKNELLRTISAFGMYTNAAIFALLVWRKTFGAPNAQQDKLLLIVFALELVVFLANAGLAVSGSFGLHETQFLPYLRTVLVAAGMVLGIGGVVGFHMLDDHAEIERIKRAHSTQQVRNTLELEHEQSRIMQDAKLAQVARFRNLYERALNSDEVYDALRSGAVNQALEYGEHLGGIRIQRSNLPAPRRAETENFLPEASEEAVRANGSGNGKRKPS